MTKKTIKLGLDSPGNQYAYPTPNPPPDTADIARYEGLLYMLLEIQHGCTRGARDITIHFMEDMDRQVWASGVGHS